MFATYSWPSLCKQSELQCWRRNRRLCGSVQISATRALPRTFDISILNALPFRGRCRLSTNLDFLDFEHPPFPYTCQRTRDGVQTCLVPDGLASGSRPVRIWEPRRARLGAATVASWAAYTDKNREWEEKDGRTIVFNANRCHKSAMPPCRAHICKTHHAERRELFLYQRFFILRILANSSLYPKFAFPYQIHIQVNCLSKQNTTKLQSLLHEAIPSTPVRPLLCCCHRGHCMRTTRFFQNQCTLLGNAFPQCWRRVPSLTPFHPQS